MLYCYVVYYLMYRCSQKSAKYTDPSLIEPKECNAFSVTRALSRTASSYRRGTHTLNIIYCRGFPIKIRRGRSVLVFGKRDHVDGSRRCSSGQDNVRSSCRSPAWLPRAHSDLISIEGHYLLQVLHVCT